MKEEHIRWLAEELIEMQDGSIEDAKALVDWPLTEDEQAEVIWQIEEIDRERRRKVDDA